MTISNDWDVLFNKKLPPSPTFSRLKEQYIQFKLGEALEIADEKIKKIPIKENNEEMVDVKELEMVDVKNLNGARVSMLSDPEKLYSGPENNAGLPESSKVRKEVWKRLQQMVTQLDILAHLFGYKIGQLDIKVFEAHRSLESQKMIFEHMLNGIKEKKPTLSREELEKETSKWASPYKDNVPPHSTGAAVDIRLWDNKKKEFVDLAGFSVGWSRKELAPIFADDPEITIEHKRRRYLVALAAERAGLTTYTFEHWHLSYGDAYDAYMQEREHAVYGAV